MEPNSIKVEILEAASGGTHVRFDSGTKLYQFKTGSGWYSSQKTRALAPREVYFEQHQLLSPCVQFPLKTVGFYPFQSICRPANGLQ